MAKLIDRILPGGQTMTEIDGYGGDADFYTVYELVERLIQPEAQRTTIDSLCVGGSFRRDGITVRMSSEGITDNFSFVYDARGLSGAETEKLRSWLGAVAGALPERN